MNNWKKSMKVTTINFTHGYMYFTMHKRAVKIHSIGECTNFDGDLEYTFKNYNANGRIQDVKKLSLDIEK